MTSNVGSRQLKDFEPGWFFTTARQASQIQNTQKLLKMLLINNLPEFLNRIDDIIIFNPLEKKIFIK